MNFIASVTAFLSAATYALRAFPLWLVWRQSRQIESLQDELIELEAAANPADRARLDRVRVKYKEARKQHEALLAISAATESRADGADR